MQSSISTRQRKIAKTTQDIMELAIRNNGICFFAGAGISLASGLPSWPDFISRVIANSFEEHLSKEDLSRIYDGHDPLWHLDSSLSFAAKSAKKKRSQILNEGLWGSEKTKKKIEPNLNHHFLVMIAFKLNVPIFTTNLDNLFQEAANNLSIKMPEGLPNKNTTRLGFRLIHIHGKIDRVIKRKNSKKQVVSQFDYFREFDLTGVFRPL